MGRLFLIDLQGDTYVCRHCSTHVAYYDDIVAKTFFCVRGKAYLFENVVNVTVGVHEERMMMTGLHIVGDVFCVGCGSPLGWKYITAYEKSQKFKEGKFILERVQIHRPNKRRPQNDSPQSGGTDAEVA